MESGEVEANSGTLGRDPDKDIHRHTESTLASLESLVSCVSLQSFLPPGLLRDPGHQRHHGGAVRK
jgi:hypothetical protein